MERQQHEERTEVERLGEPFRPHVDRAEHHRRGERHQHGDECGERATEAREPPRQHVEQHERHAAERRVDRERRAEHRGRIVREPVDGAHERRVTRAPRAVVVHVPTGAATADESGHRQLSRLVRPDLVQPPAARRPQAGCDHGDDSDSDGEHGRPIAPGPSRRHIERQGGLQVETQGVGCGHGRSVLSNPPAPAPRTRIRLACRRYGWA